MNGVSIGFCDSNLLACVGGLCWDVVFGVAKSNEKGVLKFCNVLVIKIIIEKSCDNW